MYRFDETGWPIVRISASEYTSFADVEEYISRWESWLGRGGPFGVILIYEDDEHGKVEKGTRKLSNRWHKENRERTGKHCAWISGVVKSSKLLAVYKPVASRAMKKTMGCPGPSSTTSARLEHGSTNASPKVVANPPSRNGYGDTGSGRTVRIGVVRGVWDHSASQVGVSRSATRTRRDSRPHEAADDGIIHAYGRISPPAPPPELRASDGVRAG